MPLPLFKSIPAIEGFYRSANGQAQRGGPQGSSVASHSSTMPSPSQLSTEVTLDFDSAPGAITASAVTASSMAATLAYAPAPVRHASLRAPGDLGVSSTPGSPVQTTARKTTHSAPNLENGGRHRSIAAIKSSQSIAAAAAVSQNLAAIKQGETLNEASLVCTVAYRGMEVIFSTVARNLLVGVCARTRVMLQTLDLPGDDVTVVRVVSNPENGIIVVAMSDGTIMTYHPVKTSSKVEPKKISSCFGRYRWINGPKASCREVFHLGAQGSGTFFSFHGDDSVDVSSASDYRLLVAYHDQLAIFDAKPIGMISSVASKMELIWTTTLDRAILSAKISGDGDAIVLVVQGEGTNNDNPFGARTFIRDMEDGAALDAALYSGIDRERDAPIYHLSNSSAVGVVYTPGPFLVHASSVSQISFRGFGHVTSSVQGEEKEGNDLLLTFCSGDSSVRIFSQNSWKQIMHWTSPPCTRVDWVRGITAFNLGDLEARKSRKRNVSSRRPSVSSGEDTTPFNSLRTAKTQFQPAPKHPSPSSAGGAWIAELTFRSDFPALRLSRLSYMKRGSEDAQPAHFESVAAVLPAGSVISESALALGDMGLSIQGIWPAWPLQNSDTRDVDESGTLDGSAMAFLGLALTPQTSHGFFGDVGSGGTHSPPSELRIVASHPLIGKVILMEFPLWADQDYCAVELGNPLRYVLSLDDAATKHFRGAVDTKCNQTDTNGNESLVPEPVCLEYESSTLSARVDHTRESVSIVWRKQASMSILPASRFDRSPDYKALLSSDPSILSSAFASPADETALFQDMSVVPIPLSLPPLRLPKSAEYKNEKIAAMKWWPDDNYGGPPQLIVATASGSIILYELPPPWSALEPAMPESDPFQVSANESIPESLAEIYYQNGGSDDSDSDLDEEGTLERDYDVMITPHPDFGIGLRLEGQLEGMPSIAGSFKKHPLNGGRLPAERTGMIWLGDELLSVNGVSLEGISFDEIIGTVREVSAESTSGEPLCMRFRPSMENRKLIRTMASTLSENETQTSDASLEKRRILRVNPKVSKGNNSQSLTERASLIPIPAHLAVAVEQGTQQEFGRIIDVIHGVLKPNLTRDEVYLLQQNIVLTKWKSGIEAVNSKKLRGSALLIVAEGTWLRAKCIEVPATRESERARCFDLGSLDLTKVGWSGKTVNNLRIVQTPGGDSSCVSVCDETGRLAFVFIEIQQVQDVQDEATGNACVDAFEAHPSKSGLRAIFRFFPLFDVRHSKVQLFRPFSAELAAVLSRDPSGIYGITVWTSKPSPGFVKDCVCHDGDELTGVNYSKSELPTELLLQSEIVDFRFIVRGPLDAFPLIAVFTKASVIAFRCSSAGASWEPVVEIIYPTVESSLCIREAPRPKVLGAIPSPADLFPHLASTIRSICDSSFECDYVKSDWQPDVILSSLFTESHGAVHALQRNVTNIYQWLSLWSNDEEGIYPPFDRNFPHGVVPLHEINGHLLLQTPDTVSNNGERGENASALMQSRALSKGQENPSSDEKSALLKLQSLLCPSRRTFERGLEYQVSNRSNEFKIAMALASGEHERSDKRRLLPPPLQNLSVDELRLLWAVGEIVVSPPDVKSLDVSAQHALMCITIFRVLERAKNGEESESGLAEKVGLSIRNINDQLHGSMRVKNTFSFYTAGPAPKPSIASAACIAALTSNSQLELIDACRPVNDKFSWENVRSLRLPFWVRSDEVLKKLSEEVGQKEYRDTRDIMKCSLYFIIVGNMRTLRNLAATDQSITGKTFLKFINSYDFASDRGRNAAEKNAYSLLSKRKHIEAVAFFLLADPPMLKTAIECIVTKMGDLDLAFFVLRLLDPSQNKKFESIGCSGGFNLSAMMGGGGGYASGSHLKPTAAPDVINFKDWTPKLKTGARDLLKEKGIPSAPKDVCFISLQLIWLGRPEEASHRLSGLSTDSEESEMSAPRSFDKSVFAPILTSHFGFTHQQSDSGSANRRVITKCNDIINFSSRPLLTSLMKASARSRWAATLIVGKALTNRGVELFSARSIIQNTSQSDFDVDTTKRSVEARFELGGSSVAVPNCQSSSIFDSFDVQPPSASVLQQTSIFDSYDGPSPSRSHPTPVNNPTSSIFDSFEPGPQKAATVFSIFDSFDVPNPNRRTTVLTSDPMQSSIFDSFDVPKSQTSTFFDSSDGRTDRSSSKIGAMSSSIFDSFDGPANLSATANSQKTAEVLEATPLDFNGVATPEKVKLEQDIVSHPIPLLWREWRDSILAVSVARRLIRDMLEIVSLFHGDARDVPISLFCNQNHAFIRSCASDILRTTCDGVSILSKIRTLVNDLCCSCRLDRSLVLDQALCLLDSNAQPAHILLCVLLHSLSDRSDLADDVVREAALLQIERCEAMALSNDDLVDNKRTLYQGSSQYLRRLCVRVSWQLELCLWLHRGGVVPLSSLVLKEATIAVRIGFVIASWNRNHDCLEALIRCEPDCELDPEIGRQLWSSTKLISGMDIRTPKSATGTGSSSGGWEFLVDCRREEATSMLKRLPPGSFIIRPHTEDNGVFTLSFKTNLTPTVDPDEVTEKVDPETADVSHHATDLQENPSRPPNPPTVKKDDVVQHAIIRLSDAGFRCGSFGPFASLLKLLEAVSASLPFHLLFNKPPIHGIIKDGGAQPSPNGIFLRKFALTTHSDSMRWDESSDLYGSGEVVSTGGQCKEIKTEDMDQLTRLGTFCQLLTLSEMRKQLSGIAAAQSFDVFDAHAPIEGNVGASIDHPNEHVSVTSTSSQPGYGGILEHYALAARIMRPLLVWCRMLETREVFDIAPSVKEILADSGKLPVTLSASETAIECAPPTSGGLINGGDAMIRSMIQPESGVDFRTLRVGEGGDSAMIVLFSKRDATKWLVASGTETEVEGALMTLGRMERRRVIEPIALSDLSLKASTNQSRRGKDDERVCYRFVDPWEVEALENRAGETMSAALGRENYLAFSVSAVASSCESSLRKLGGLHCLGLWTNSKGGIRLTKAIASVHAPWERDAGGDLQMCQGSVTEATPFFNSIRQHLYRNDLFRRLHMPQRFMALVQVELLDLKNLNAPGGTSLSVYALLRLKRPGSSAPLSHKARTLDSAATLPVKVGKSSHAGPNAPASWGSLVRFRFPLPEDVNCDGVSMDGDREALFKGPPSTLQISVYEKKFMSDIALGGADVKLDSLATGGQLEEWVPLRSEKRGIHWFARIRLTLRFELMCIRSEDMDNANVDPPSVGLRKIQLLSKMGGTHEDSKVKKSASTQDLMTYFESMVY